MLDAWACSCYTIEDTTRPIHKFVLGHFCAFLTHPPKEFWPPRRGIGYAPAPDDNDDDDDDDGSQYTDSDPGGADDKDNADDNNDHDDDVVQPDPTDDVQVDALIADVVHEPKPDITEPNKTRSGVNEPPTQQADT